MLVSDRLRKVFIAVLDLEDGIDVSGLRHRGHPSWDSLNHLALVLAIEEEFDIEIESDQLIQMDSFPAVLGILADLGVVDGTDASGSGGR